MSAYNLSASKQIMPESSAMEELNFNDCVITLRRVEGEKATELYFVCKPTVRTQDAGVQARGMYAALNKALVAEGADLNAVISETVFMRNMRNIERVRHQRKSVIEQNGGQAVLPALTEIQQPPLDPNAHLELAVQALVAKTVQTDLHQVRVMANDAHGAVREVSAMQITMDDEARLLAGGLCGDGENAYTQTQHMFELAEKLLHEAGMQFSDVVRTWIYLREMERDYPQLNQARREFFASRGIDPVPASTGIEGGMVNPEHDLCLGFYAVKSGQPLLRKVMTSPTLNEAGEYGADFVRGMKMLEANKVALHVSGTASIDEAGRTAHIGNIDAQIDRMILNIKALLDNQGADFGDIVYAYNYLKDPADEALLKAKFDAAGLVGFPSVFVHAAVCRPDLLCETEVLAILPRTNTSGHPPHIREA